MKAERVQFRYSFLEGWVLVDDTSNGLVAGEQPHIWTAYEMADHLEACELVPEIGMIADRHCIAPQLDVRRNVLFVTLGKDSPEGLTEADFDFAEEIDEEIGPRLKASCLVKRIS